MLHHLSEHFLCALKRSKSYILLNCLVFLTRHFAFQLPVLNQNFAAIGTLLRLTGAMAVFKLLEMSRLRVRLVEAPGTTISDSLTVQPMAVKCMAIQPLAVKAVTVKALAEVGLVAGGATFALDGDVVVAELVQGLRKIVTPLERLILRTLHDLDFFQRFVD